MPQMGSGKNPGRDFWEGQDLGTAKGLGCWKKAAETPEGVPAQSECSGTGNQGWNWFLGDLKLLTHC